MVSLLGSMAILILGYLIYGAAVERALGPDERIPPAVARPDGVDYLSLPLWKSLPIQLVNVVGLNAILGALAGALWGPVVYLWLVLGTLCAGAVLDYLAGMLSERNNGATVAKVIGLYLGPFMGAATALLTMAMLVLMGASLARTSAYLLVLAAPGIPWRIGLALILGYCFLDGLLPLNHLACRLYPLLALAVLALAAALGWGLFQGQFPLLELWEHWGNLYPSRTEAAPLWPAMLVAASWAVVSGMRATQSPLVARCLTGDAQGRRVFYGAAAIQGLVALVWAAAGAAIYGGTDGLMVAALRLGNQFRLIQEICTTLIGPRAGLWALLGLAACAVGCGDMAFRVARLTLADGLDLDQRYWSTRLVLSTPLVLCGVGLSLLDLRALWWLFTWANLVLAAVVLWAGAVYLVRRGRNHWISTAPATVLTALAAHQVLLAPQVHLLVARALVIWGVAFPPGQDPLALVARTGFYLGFALALLCLILFYFRVRPTSQESV